MSGISHGVLDRTSFCKFLQTAGPDENHAGRQPFDFFRLIEHDSPVEDGQGDEFPFPDSHFTFGFGVERHSGHRDGVFGIRSMGRSRAILVRFDNIGHPVSRFRQVAPSS